MSDTSFYVVLHHPNAMPGQARAAVAKQLLPAVDAMFARGVDRVRLTAEEEEDAITREQRAYLHAGVLTQIAEEAVANGTKYPMKVWKEWYRSEFLGFKVVTSINPFTGKKSRRRVRVSTEDLGRRALAEYTERVIAHASTDLNLTIRPPMKKEVRDAMKRFAERGQKVDADTGEIMEHA